MSIVVIAACVFVSGLLLGMALMMDGTNWWIDVVGGIFGGIAILLSAEELSA